MIIECPYCDSKVVGLVKGEIESYDPHEDPAPWKVILMQCPSCKNALFGCSESIQVGPNKNKWTDPDRLWPKQESEVSWDIPSLARDSLIEAKLCFRAKAYSASVVMFGRALEGVCKHFSTKKKDFSAGLKELKEKAIIDARLLEWSEELRKHRNISAHPSDERVTKEDAADLLDFANAICEYVFVLTEKFNKFMTRKLKN